MKCSHSAVKMADLSDEPISMSHAGTSCCCCFSLCADGLVCGGGACQATCVAARAPLSPSTLIHIPGIKLRL